MGESPLTHNESIIEKLDKAAAAVVPLGTPQTRPWPPAWFATDEGATFRQEVKEADSLHLFDDTLQLIWKVGAVVSRDQLANWMVERARIVGARQTVEEVDKYITSDSFEAYQVMLLSGLPVDSKWDLGNHIQLVPPYAVPNQRLEEAVRRGRWNGLPTPEISSALICPFSHQRIHVSQADAGERMSFPPLADEIQLELQDARLCLSLVRPGGCGVQAIGSTTVARDDVPILSGCGWHIRSYRSPSHEAPLISIEAQTAKSLREDFSALDPADQDHLRIPMQKLNECAASVETVQSAIDLRVALESLFLVGANSNRLGRRAAGFIGGDHERQEETRKNTDKAYKLCSQAVHHGRLTLNRTEAETLKGATNLVRDSLCRMIRDGDGKPDWKIMERAAETNKTPEQK